MYAITPCGQRKRDVDVSPALHLYTGSYFRACARYAIAAVGPDRVLILSAKHGLIRLDKLLTPYNVRFGMAGAVGRATLERQRDEYGIGNTPALVLGGKDYVKQTENLFAQRFVLTEFMGADAGGMGLQIGWLTRNRGRLPPGIS